MSTNADLLPNFSGKSRAKLSRFLDTVGDGSGTKNAIGNYAAATSFKLKPFTETTALENSQRFLVQGLTINIEDAGEVKADNYGAGAALTNGVLIYAKNAEGTVLANFTDGIAIKKNGQFGRLGTVSATVTGATDNFVTAKIDFTNDGANEGLRLDGKKGEYLEVVLQDDFSSIVGHYFVATGLVLQDSVTI